MKKKIIHIIYSGLGGHKDFVFNLIDNQYENQVWFYGIEKVPIETISELNKLKIDYKFFPKKKGLDLKSIITIFRELLKADKSYLIIHVNSLLIPVSFFSILQPKFTIVFIEHQANHLKTKLEWLYTSLSFFLAGKIVYLTKEYKEQVKKRVRNFKESKTYILKTGIPDFWFKNHFEKIFEPNKILIGMQSRITPNKDHKTLIRAFKEINNSLPNSELHIAGEGIELDNLISYTKSLDLENAVFFHGFIDQKGLIKFLDNLDIYVHSTFGETLSIALIQAHSRRLPVIATNVKGVNNYLSNKLNGLLFELGNYIELKEKIYFLISNQDQRLKLSEKGFEYAKMYHSGRTMNKEFLEILSV